MFSFFNHTRIYIFFIIKFIHLPSIENILKNIILDTIALTKSTTESAAIYLGRTEMVFILTREREK